MSEKLDLSQIDFNSPTWRAVGQRLRTERDVLRARVECNGLDHSATQYLRGRIHQINDLIAIEDSLPPSPDRRAAPKADIYS